VRNASDALILVDLAAGATGARYVSEVAQLAALGTVLAFSRDQEREADDIGFEELLRAGYDVHEAPEIWEAIIAERDAADDPQAFIFFSTHPSSEERVKTLRRLADQAQADTKAQDKGRDEHLAVIRPFRGEWLRDELDRRDFAALQVVLENLRKGGDQLGEIDYFQGELYRLRSQDGDVERAIGAYRRAGSEPGAPAETHRELGLLYWQSGQLGQARESFHRYLDAAPGATDREMIDSYLEEMGA
jgi:tetratricopeptide (TPR) repeat protein